MIYSISRAALLHELERLHMASGAVDILQRKSEIIPFKLTDVRTPAGNIIKQEMLAAGGDCATPFGSITCSTEVEDIVLLGTEKHYRRLMDKLKLMPYFGLAEISEELKSALSRQQKRTVLSDGRAITYDRCLVMGIINVTPDSFYAGSRRDADSAVETAGRMLEDGADLLDIGGESTRPGSKPVSVDTEIERVVHVIKRIRSLYPEAVISVDTWHARTAEEAFMAGADILNDVTAFSGDPDMEKLALDNKIPSILVHSFGSAASPSYEKDNDIDIVREVVGSLSKQANWLGLKGYPAEKVILDPGIGFGKSRAQDLELLKGLEALSGGAYPVLLAASRKRVIGDILDLPTEERLEGSLAIAARAVESGCSMIRVHDVRETIRFIKMMEAMK